MKPAQWPMGTGTRIPASSFPSASTIRLVARVATVTTMPRATSLARQISPGVIPAVDCSSQPLPVCSMSVCREAITASSSGESSGMPSDMPASSAFQALGSSGEKSGLETTVYSESSTTATTSTAATRPMRRCFILANSFATARALTAGLPRSGA